MKTPWRRLATLVVLAAPLSAAPVLAQENPWAVRLGVTDLVPANKSAPIGALGVPADKIDVSRKVIPELDVSYFFTSNLAAELVLSYPQRHEVTVEGTSLGTFKELPPTLLAQWHFLPGQAFDPYLGAGVNWTWITPVNLSVPGVGTIDLSHSSWGYALQAGGDVNLDRNWFLNLDVKYVTIGADVKLFNGTKVSDVHVNPYLYSLGVGYRF